VFEQYPVECAVRVEDFDSSTEYDDYVGNVSFVPLGSVHRVTPYKEKNSGCRISRAWWAAKGYDVDAYVMANPNHLSAYRSIAKYDRDYSVSENQCNEEAFAFAELALNKHFYWCLGGSSITPVDNAIYSLTKSTSCGFPWNYICQNKTQFFQKFPDVCRDYWNKMHLIPLWFVSVKQEIRSSDRINFFCDVVRKYVEKLRTFTAAPVHFTVFLVMLCLDFNNKFYESHNQTWSAVGMTKFYRGFDTLYMRLTKNVDDQFVRNAFELDCEEYDSRLIKKWFVSIMRFRYLCFLICYQIAYIADRLRYAYTWIVYSIMVLTRGELVMKTGGNPSGSANTIVDNTLILYMAFAYAWYRLAPPEACTYEDFQKHVVAALCGDDNTYCTSDFAVGFFHPKNVQSALAEVGFRVTTPCYEPRKLHECAFLSHNWVYNRQLQCWVPVPERAKVISSLCNNTRKNDIRWTLMRAYALRIESWGDEELRPILQEYISWIRRVHGSSLKGEVDGITMEQIYTMDKSDSELARLYGGLESAVDGDMNMYHKWHELEPEWDMIPNPLVRQGLATGEVRKCHMNNNQDSLPESKTTVRNDAHDMSHQIMSQLAAIGADTVVGEDGILYIRGKFKRVRKAFAGVSEHMCVLKTNLPGVCAVMSYKRLLEDTKMSQRVCQRSNLPPAPSAADAATIPWMAPSEYMATIPSEYVAEVGSQINGNNGSATNTDDHAMRMGVQKKGKGKKGKPKPVKEIIVRTPERQPPPRKFAKQNLIGDLAAAAAAGAGQGWAAPIAKTVGDKAGSWLWDVGKGLFDRITGHGTYTLHGNSMLHKIGAGMAPRFSGTGKSRVAFQEMIMPIYGSTGFTNLALSLNPGLLAPWLRGFAAQFDTYKIHGMVFEYMTASTDYASTSSLGLVVMATQYITYETAFADLQTMMNYEFSCSDKPSNSFLHPIECAPRETPIKVYRVRTGAAPLNADVGMYDVGTLNIATNGNQSTNQLGFLKVTYDIEFYKNRDRETDGLIATGAHFGKSATVDAAAPNYTNSTPIPTNLDPTGSTLSLFDTIGIVTTATKIIFPANFQGGIFKVDLIWYGTAAASITYPSITYTSNCQAAPNSPFNYVSGGSTNSPAGSVSSVLAFLSFGVQITGPNATITLGAGGTLPGTPNGFDLWVLQVDDGLFLKTTDRPEYFYRAVKERIKYTRQQLQLDDPADTTPVALLEALARCTSVSKKKKVRQLVDDYISITCDDVERKTQ